MTILAGASALKQIKKDGLHPEQIKAFIGASGGPKWFVLYGLDRYLFGEFFPQKKRKLHSLGSSAGAWRMACLAQKRPVSAIARLAQQYSQETYSAHPSAKEISLKAAKLLDYVLDENGCQQILSNQNIQTHIVTARSKGLLASEKPLIQGAGLLLSASANAFHRRTLRYFYQRTLFHSGEEQPPFFNYQDMPTTHVQLTQSNIKQALMASGAIPMVLEGIQGIQGAPKGVYRDGGIIDYHFDFRFNPGDELVLYPHFSQRIVPGWFDKALKWRKISPHHYDNVVVVTPSADFVEKLPYSKISDRSDFTKMDATTRLKYWQTILSESHRIADEFSALVESGQGLNQIKPLFGV